MENQTNQKSLNKLTKGAIAMIIASAVVFPATNVFADETTSETPIIDLQADSHSDGDKEQIPSLLPGDFFYFSKILVEKIRLALTIDDVKEANLIAEYAAERLSEAEALFADGNEEAALETMKKAIDNIEIADDHVTNLEESASGEIVENETELNQAKDAVSQNIIALTAAMEKVKNPVAKTSLQKNIQKSYAKFAKKMEKREKKQQKITEYSAENAADIDPKMETSTPEVEEGVATPEVTLPVTPQPSKKDTQQTAVQEKKSARQEIQQETKEAKSVGTEKKAEMKQAVKELKQESKGN
ncbi:hypothetical protein QFZ28_004411 [Neobacillus niacini]|uniref:DUF5667 domain-containing protein n=1 Tax=Neobacillus niacini TaxID=86668 RepID=UPI002781A831|nr:DUF5667 domain-containing protein [Neobacillus niacini]MDQ1004011.1 hypothetical protein [Neobacillus niacini]